MKEYLMLCKKVVKTNDGQEFPTYFGYRQGITDEGDFYDELSPAIDKEGNSIMVARAVKVRLSKLLEAKLNSMVKFPCRLTLDITAKTENGKAQYFVTKDKDKNGNPRLDKHGKQHAVVVINDVVAFEEVERQSYTLSDIDSLEGLE